eukprot:sb/3464734/
MLYESGVKLKAHLKEQLYPPPSHLVAQFVEKACSAVSNTEGVVRVYTKNLWDHALETASHFGWNDSLLREIPVPVRHKLLSHLKQVRKDWPGAVVPNVALQLVEPELSHSIEFLQKLSNTPLPLTLPQLHANNKLALNVSNVLSTETVAAQTHYDLGEIFFYYSSYNVALTHFQSALTNFKLADAERLNFTEAKVLAYVRGLEFLFSTDKSEMDSITAQLEACRGNNFEGCVGVLLLDNQRRELALSERRMLLREIREKSSDQKLHTMAFLCNVKLEVILGYTVPQLFWDVLKGERDLVLDFLVFAIKDFLQANKCTCAIDRLKMFVLSIMARKHTRNRAQDILKHLRGPLGLPSPSYQSLMPSTAPVPKLAHPQTRDVDLVECYERLTATQSFNTTRDVISKICSLQPNFRAQSYCDMVYRTPRNSQFSRPSVTAFPVRGL